MRLFILCLTLISSLETMSQFVRLDSTSKSIIEGFITQEKHDEEMVGVSVGIIRDGHVAFLKGFGWQDTVGMTPASEQTMYRLASVSKTVTGLMAMKLVEQGLLDLDKDIRDYVPEYPVKPEGTITMEELLSNESGIIHYSGTSSGQYCSESYNTAARDDYIDNHPNAYDPIAAIDIFKDQKICFAPGLHYQYTTWGFCLAGAVVERAGSKAFEEILNEQIVCPLGLPTLQIEFQDERPYPNEAWGYDFDDQDKLIRTPTTWTDYKDVSYKVPGGGLISSVIDLTLLMQGIVNRTLMPDQYVKLFGTRHEADDGNPTYYGYGTSTGSRNGDSLYWHSGSQAKTATLIYYSPENKNGVAIMSNTRGVSLFPLARLIYDYLPNAQIEGEPYQNPSKQSECTVSIFEDEGVSGITLYPNPASTEINLMGQKSEVKALEVLNQFGQIVRSQRGPQETLDIQHLSSGVYFLRVRMIDKTTTLAFVVK